MPGLSHDSGFFPAWLRLGQPGLTSEHTRGCSAIHIVLPGLQAILECQAAQCAEEALEHTPAARLSRLW